MHKPSGLFIVLFILSFFNANAAVNDTLKVVNWNVEYFGDKASELPNEMFDCKTIMDSLNADVYALVEVVNKDSLNSLVKSLNGDYDYMIAPFGTSATSPQSGNWAKDQKQAIVWRKSVIRNVTGRAYMKSSSAAYDEWSSGRFPFLVEAEVLGSDNKWGPIKFIIIHSKAYSDATSCTRRRDGALELKDSLDQYMMNERFILLGDYNDDLDVTICSNFTTSNYENFVVDSSNYHALTLPLSLQGINSINGYPSFIDHVIVNDKMYPYYIPGSAEMLKNKVTSWVSGYNTYVSDHFPVETKYVITTPTGINSLTQSNFKVFPNPVKENFIIEQSQAADAYYELYTLTGQRILSSFFHQKNIQVSLENIPTGTYFLRVLDSRKNTSFSTTISKE